MDPNVECMPPLDDGLLPCPLCGGKSFIDFYPIRNNASVEERKQHRAAECSKCSLTLYRFRDTQAEADTAIIETWNSRYNNTEVKPTFVSV